MDLDWLLYNIVFVSSGGVLRALQEMAWQMEQLTVSPRALEDIVVVEVGHGVALGYCGALLQACGATLTKVEVSSGDTVRHTPPFAPNTAPPEASGFARLFERWQTQRCARPQHG